VVGKYRYEAREPLGGSRLPLMLDVLLVGRTKMLRLHSCLWLENNTGMRLEPCLSLGSYCSTPVVLGPGDKLDSLQRLHLRVGSLHWWSNRVVQQGAWEQKQLSGSASWIPVFRLCLIAWCNLQSPLVAFLPRRMHTQRPTNARPVRQPGCVLWSAS
jgi:hypothetical protein